MALATLVDTGPLIAAFEFARDGSVRYRDLLQRAAHERWSLMTTWPCVAEASYMLDIPQRYSLLRWLGVGGAQVYAIDSVQLGELADMMARWTEPPRTEMDLADASLVWLAGRTGTVRIMTTDMRDFSRYRLSDGRAFEIL